MTDCAGHDNGFERLDVNLGGAEQGFHLSYKFERVPLPYVRETFLLLYVNYSRDDSIHFARREPEGGQVAPDELMNAALPRLTEALLALKERKPLPWADRPLFL